MIDISKNDFFSHMKGSDLRELFNNIKQFDLFYRSHLNLPLDVTFGVEIEYEHISRKELENKIKSFLDDWDSKDEETVDLGGEISSPKLYDDKYYWQKLKEICQLLKKSGAKIGDLCGGHVHIGEQILGDQYENWRRFLKIYMTYENILFKFGYNEKLTARAALFDYAKPIAYELSNMIIDINNALSIEDIGYSIMYFDKINAVNFSNTSILDFYGFGTIEFRFPNGTLDEITWQNNINALVKLMLASTQGSIDEEYLDYKIEHEIIPRGDSFKEYNKIYFKNALEFADLIFNNNLDKIFFLKQYFKNFEDNYGMNSAIKAKSFTR